MTELIGRWAQAPDLIEPIIGYRAWHFTMSDREAHLYPLNWPMFFDHTAEEWEGAWRDWVASSCSSSDGPVHVSPDENCTCGFYAMKSGDDSPLVQFVVATQAAGASSQTSFERPGAVFGRVDLAGKIIEHEFGYRAERARIGELIPTSTDGGITTSLAARLGLPVGSALETTGLFESFCEEIRSEELAETLPPGPRRLTPIERWQLKTHRPHLRLITGGRADG